MKRILSTFALGVLVLALRGPAPARASCVFPEAKLLWSYPADGATEVPTNATFWAVSSAWGALPLATLDDAALPATAVTAVTTSGVRIDPGALAPETDYVLQLEYGAADAGAPLDAGARAFRLSFRTGKGPAPAPAPAAVSGEEVDPESDTQALPGCAEQLLQAQGCLDTGPRAVHTFHATATGAIAWLVAPATDEPFERDALWPVSCSEPKLSLHAQFPPSCYSLRAIGEGGLLGEATRFCPPAPPTPQADAAAAPSDEPDAGAATVAHPGSAVGGSEPDSSGSCSAPRRLGRPAASPALAAVALLALAAFVRARRGKPAPTESRLRTDP